MQRIKAEIVLWTAGFVLMTLVINAPLLPFFLRVSGLAKGEPLCCAEVNSFLPSVLSCAVNRLVMMMMMMMMAWK